MAREPKKTDEELKRDIEKIYTDSEGQLPDFTRLEGKPGNRLRSALVGALTTLAVLAAVTWGGFFFFSRTTGFTGEHVELRVESETGFTAGKEAEVIVRYRNNERVPLARASLRLKAPDGFIVSGAEPVQGDDGEWAIGSIPPGGESSVRLKGLVRKEIEATMTFVAELNYKPADFNSEFQKVASHTVAVQDSVLKLKADGPDQMTPGDEIAFVFEYENTSDQPLEDMRIAVDPVEGFVVSSVDPAADQDVALRWTFPKMEAGAKGAVTVKGTFSSTSRGPKRMQARAGFVDDGDLLAVAKAEAETEVLKSDLALSLIVNGSDKPAAASFGDTLFFSLRYENTGDVSLKEVTLTADLASELKDVEVVDWVSLRDELEGKRTGSAIAWTKKQIPGLAVLAPGDKGEINFSVQLIKKPADGNASPNYGLSAKLTAVIGKAGASGSREVATAPLVIRFLSDAAFKAYGRYFTEDGTPVGSGPLPPQVGQKTVYRIHWAVQNTLHELTNLSISTLLPQGVKWTGVSRPVDAGDLSFDETGRKATWRLNRMPTSVTALTITFDVELTPEFEDIGNILDLTGENRFEAFDKDVETVILKTEAPIGTDLIGDEHAAGKGVVKE